MTSLLFLCVANSARSQMAEGIAQSIFGPTFKVESAGSEPTQVHPLAIEVLAEIGIDISSQYAKSVSSIDLTRVDVVVTLCQDEVCPILVGQTKRFHWPLPDPATAADEATQRAAFRSTRDALVERIKLLKHQLACDAL